MRVLLKQVGFFTGRGAVYVDLICIAGFSLALLSASQLGNQQRDFTRHARVVGPSLPI